ncbi:hypothetical protein [Streptomyces sp. NPDC006552]|uniref:hypothetical protein n=1 Tax=Streptomyces sp. NPDC006552 TaxID=3157179 RepID=UPI0033B096EE
MSGQTLWQTGSAPPEPDGRVKEKKTMTVLLPTAAGPRRAPARPAEPVGRAIQGGAPAPGRPVAPVPAALGDAA